MSIPSDSLSAANISSRLSAQARANPNRKAVIVPAHHPSHGLRIDLIRSFAELEAEVDNLAFGLRALGIRPGHKIALMVRPGFDFIALTFALFRTGAVIVLIDPGMGRSSILNCLDEIRPDGYVAIPIVQLIRWWKGKRPAFNEAKLNVTVGRRIPGLGPTIANIRNLGRLDAHRQPHPTVGASDPAAIIFTSGSTGPPKGVLYEHGMFSAQVDLIQRMYGIEPGEVDLPGFPLFGLFNAAMGVTTVVPDMDPTRPAHVDPVKIIDAVTRHGVTQAFGSPAFWNRVGRHCEAKRITLPGLKRALSAGGPVPNHVLQRMAGVLNGSGADLFTPYGATESLPVASIGAREVLASTAARSRAGAGTCVGRAFPQTDIRVIEITEGPIASIDEARILPAGEIGEIVVRSPSVTREYYGREEASRLAKIPDSRPHSGDSRPSVWHRIGDVGYLDEAGLLWFCGRKAHIVETESQRMHSVCCEAIFENHPDIDRAALVGIGEPGRQRPVLIAEPEAGRFPESDSDRSMLKGELMALGASSPLTSSIREFLFHPSLPVDTRHNVKIQREALRTWAAEQLGVHEIR
jgi:acyl-CoA synthetase (AMP-forming)/AMP-acid ligase II